MAFSKQDEIIDIYGKKHQITPAPDDFGPFIPSSLIHDYYDYYDEVDTDELNYMHYYINEENMKKLKDISKMLGLGNYKFDEEGNTREFIEKYFPIELDNRKFKEDVLDGYLSDLGYAIGAARTEAVNEYVDSQQ